MTVDDPYNMYFTPDGKSAINVAEARKRLDFLDPHTMALQSSLDVPGCGGINHADFTIDGRYVIFTCEFQGSLVKIDVVNRSVVGYLQLSGGGMPQDIRSSPDGSTFDVAEMMRGGIYTVDPSAFTEIQFHPLRRRRAVPESTARSSTSPTAAATVGPNGPGSVSGPRLRRQIVATWPIPGGADMGNVSNDSKTSG